MNAEHMPGTIQVVMEEELPGGVRVRIVTDGVQACWEVYSPDGQLMAESQPAPLPASALEREAMAVAAAIAQRYPLEG